MLATTKRALALLAILVALAACAPRSCPCSKSRASVPRPAARGPLTAFVEIEEFSDFECPYCGRVQSTMKALFERYPGRLRHVFRHVPLAFHAHALDAARASIAAQRQGQFWPYHDRLFASEDPLHPRTLVAIAEELNLDLERFEQDFNSPETKKRIQRDLDLSKDREVHGVPHFLVNGRPIAGAAGIDVFTELIDEEIAKAEALLDEGVPPAEVARVLTERNRTL